MIFGIALLSTLSLTASPPSTPPSAEITPATAQLVTSLRREPPSRTAYTEVRFVHLLKRPLVLRGELTYAGPGELGKRVDAPYRETTTIAGNAVSVQREGKAERHFSLERAPALGALLSGFSALLGGDAAALQHDFVVVSALDHERWRLTLTPRAAALREQLTEMVVDGSGSEPHCFSLHEADGDASSMLLGALAATPLADPPTPAALDALCRGSAP